MNPPKGTSRDLGAAAGEAASPSRSGAQLPDCIAEALRVLGIDNLLLNIHDASFPSEPSEDTGRGTPNSRGGLAFLRFVRGLGFSGIQFGPQGETDAGNPSPYDATAFSRSTLSIALAPLVADSPWGGLLRSDTLAALVDARPPGRGERAQHGYAATAQQSALAEAHASFLAKGGPARSTGDASAGLAARFARFRHEHASWLVPDALFETLCEEHADRDFRRWRKDGGPALDARLFAPRPGEASAAKLRLAQLRRSRRAALSAYAFSQLLAHEQHAALRTHAAQMGLALFGDLQIGFSPRDAWRHQALLLPGYRMGAPPSRTNPDGQAWGYPVFDPRLYRAGAREQAQGPVQRLLRARLTKLFSEFDGLRIDHPHGLVCPWVYDPNVPDGVQHGARLFASPDLAEHQELAPFAIAKRAQLNPDPATPRHADDWVVDLTPAQVRRYSRLFDLIARAAREKGRARSDLVCEVLSTLPFPLARVLERHQLGRFRVTQKADLLDPADVYRSENARPEDWVMVGNHDTPPIWQLLDTWKRSRTLSERARHLAERLAPAPDQRQAFARRLEADPGLLAQAMFADLFASPARNVLVFFSDLFGIAELYNAPGSVSEDNWVLRLGADHRERYAERLRHNRALNLPLALALALRSRGRDAASRHRELLSRLDARAARAASAS